MKEIDDELGRLYRAARVQEAPTRADRSAVRTAVFSTLAASSAVVTVSGAASAASAYAANAFPLGKLALWLSAGVALGSALSSAAWVLSPPAAPSASVVSSARLAPAISAVARNVPVPPTRRDEVETPPPERPPGEFSTTASKGAASARAPVRVVAPEVAPAPSSSLLAESEGLLAIQRALTNGDPARALSLASQQSARFRGGALAEERAVLRVLALCAAGDVQNARAARARFSNDYPRSPHEKRLLNSCAK